MRKIPFRIIEVQLREFNELELIQHMTDAEIKQKTKLLYDLMDSIEQLENVAFAHIEEKPLYHCSKCDICWSEDEMELARQGTYDHYECDCIQEIKDGNHE